MNRGKRFSRSNLDDGRDHVFSLLKATRFFLMDIRLSLFRRTGRVFSTPDHTFSYSPPSHSRLCRVRPLLPFQLRVPHILVLCGPIAGAIFLLVEPSQTSLLPLHLFLLLGRLFSLDLCRRDSVLFYRSQL